VLLIIVTWSCLHVYYSGWRCNAVTAHGCRGKGHCRKARRVRRKKTGSVCRVELSNRCLSETVFSRPRQVLHIHVHNMCAYIGELLRRSARERKIVPEREWVVVFVGKSLFVITVFFFFFSTVGNKCARSFTISRVRGRRLTHIPDPVVSPEQERRRPR